MIITLNKWADQLANDLGRHNDPIFKSQAKDLIVQEYATLIKQSVDKHGYTKSLISSVYIPLTRVLNSPLEKTKKIITYVTNFKVKQPLRNANSLGIFTYVGSKDGTVSFIPSSFDELNFISHLPLVSMALRYIYENSLIYIISPTPITSIKVSSIFTDLTTSYEYISDNTYSGLIGSTPNVVVKESTDVELDIPLDIMNKVKHKLMAEELAVQSNQRND